MKTLLLCLLMVSGLSANSQPGNRLAIKFKPGIVYSVDYEGKKLVNEKLSSLSFLSNLVSITSIVPHHSQTETRLKNLELIRDIHFIQLASGTDVATAMQELRATGLFEFVEPDQFATGAGQLLTTPNDPFYNVLQWSLKNLGTFSATAVVGADIDIERAWDITTGDANTIVCVLDAGFKMDHPELAGRIWQNPGEIAGNGIDDDANGYIDDIQGWDWVNNDNNPTDDHGHGTNVASIIAAKGNNSSGMSGINWNCRLMVGKVLDATNSGAYSWIAAGIYYAIAKGVKVINISIGGTGTSAALQAACDFARANDVFLAVCMHNQNTSTPYYPAAYSSVIAIGSTSDNDRRTVPFPWSPTSGSNYGAHIDLVAPGNNILGASYVSNTSYGNWSGTSQATPEVAGVISLMLALKPNLTFVEGMNILASTSEDQVGNPLEDSPGWDQYYGYGRLNAFNALNAVLAILPVTFTDITATRSGNINKVQWSTADDAGLTAFDVEYSLDRRSWIIASTVSASTVAGGSQSYSINHLFENREVYYRIKAMQSVGTNIYSKIARISPAASPFSLHVLPIAGGIQVKASSSSTTDCACRIYSIDGKLVWKSVWKFGAGTSDVMIPVKFPAGRYQFIASGSKGEVSIPLVVQ